MTNAASAFTKSATDKDGFTQAEVKVRNILAEMLKIKKKDIRPDTIVPTETITEKFVSALDNKFKVLGNIPANNPNSKVSDIAAYYQALADLNKKPVPPKHPNTKIKQAKPETVDVNLKIEKEKPLTKIERKIIKIFNTTHNRKGEDRIVRATTQMNDTEVTAEFMHALDKEFKIFMNSLPVGVTYTAASLAICIKELRKAKKERKRLEAEKLVTTNIERRVSIVHTLSGIDINSISGSQSFETDFKFWRNFDKWYKQHGKKLRAKPKFKSAALKSIHGAATDLHAVGAMSDADKAKFDNNCVKQ